jgi:uncharacterized RDD family membrane protein YckC
MTDATTPGGSEQPPEQTPPPPPPPPSYPAGGAPAPAYGGVPSAPPPPPPGSWGTPAPPPPPGSLGSYENIYAPVGAPLADYGKRLGAWLIDWVILFVVGIVLDVIFAAAHARYGAYGLQIIVTLGYAGFLIGGQRGATVGMMALNLKCVQADGGEVSFWRAVGRGAFEYLLFVLFILPWILDMLFPIWDQKNQTLHDKVASTVVILLPKGGTTY